MKTKYICKCGRVVTKSTTADNTGNRNTAGCEGCPYLLPWGPMEWNGKGFKQDIQGYECRMSHTINYASEYRGQARDKCTLRIASLDLDFLDEIQSWIYDNAADTLRADFSRGSMRGTDFSDQGRYSLSISCAQNKQGMAAKAALIERFFAPSKKRKGKTADQEKAIVLAAIEAGKAACQRKRENMEYIISENLENDCVYAYAAKEFWVYDKQACRWYTSGFCREQYERAKQELPRLTPEDFLTDSSDYSLLDDYEIPSAALNALQEAVKSGKRDAAPFEGTNPTDAAPASPAGAGAATQSLSAAGAASLAAEPAPAFDYSGMDIATVDTLHWAEREIGEARRDYVARLAQAVYIVHDELVQNLHKQNNQHSESTFVSWCASVGLSRRTAYNLLQVNALLSGSTPEEQATLEAASPSLLYAAAKPSAPAELVQAVKDGDITTHKQYQEAMAQLKAEREARKQAEQQLADAQREHQAERESTSALLRDEQQRRQQAEQGRIAAEKETAAAQQRAAKAEAQGKKDAALVEKLQDIVLRRDNEVAEQKERADAAEIRAQQAENRPVEVAVQAPTEEQINAAAKQRTAMLEAQLHTLQTQRDDAEKRADAAENNAYLSAAEFADKAATIIDGIRASFWAMAKELQEDDFNQALEPLDVAVSRIYNREWEDGWNDSWENNEEDDQ